MAQKIIQIGSSYGITISPDILDELGWRHGTRVEIEVDEKRGTFQVVRSKEPEVKMVKGRGKASSAKKTSRRR